MSGRSTDVSGARKIVALSASATAFPVCRAVNVGTGGTATIMDADGNTITDYIFTAGYNPVQIQKLTALGTAANVWALY
jgi:hypothetical protein